ncbi:MAG: trypsin-like peptidase domain-containing protein, partial [Flavisolibacter sp.]|nr:trypsin-like peptidase domain-containing protein [Flavisolibacter sp.]
MTTQQIIELYRPAIIQIATQTSTGTGFYVKEFDLIVTNEHVVGKNAEVTIAGRLFERRITTVLYTDRKHDLAFLHPPDHVPLAEVKLGRYEDLRDGEVVVAIGHPYGLN